MRVSVITNDTSIWCMAPFTYLFNKYWSSEQEVSVVGYNPPHFAMPNNFRFFSLGNHNAPQERWSDGLIKYLNSTKDDYSVLLLEDYWLTRPVDVEAINLALDYMRTETRILRFDLTGDVMHCKGDCRDAIPAGFISHYDIVQKPPGVEYRMSFQPAIWNNKLLLSILVRHRNPWEVEMYTEVPDDMLILGTKQWPYRYANAVIKGQMDVSELKKIYPPDYAVIEKTFPEEIRRVLNE